jgi:hypothetical protein
MPWVRVSIVLLGALCLAILAGCGDSVAPGDSSPPNLLSNGDFERDGEATLDGWRVINPSLTSLVDEAAPGGGRWGLQLDADWAPTTGFITANIPDADDGDIYRLSAWVRSVSVDGGGMIGLVAGSDPGYWGAGSKWAYGSDSEWTQISLVDTVALQTGDSLWVVLSSLHTEVIQRRGQFDRAVLELLEREN